MPSLESEPYYCSWLTMEIYEYLNYSVLVVANHRGMCEWEPYIRIDGIDQTSLGTLSDRFTSISQPTELKAISLGRQIAEYIIEHDLVYHPPMAA